MSNLIEQIKDMPIEMAAKEIKLIIDNPELPDIDAQIKELQAKKKKITSMQSELKDYLRENMEACAINKIECDDFTVTLIKPRDNLKILSEADLPEDYRLQEIVYTPYKDKIKADLKAGIDVSGAELTKTKAGVKFS